MNIEELLRTGAELFQQSDLSGEAGSNLDLGDIAAALSKLTGGAGFDIGSLLQNLDGSGLGNLATSWLGDGANAAISPDQVKAVLGSGKLSEFAATLGLSEQEAAGGLSEALPKIVDNGSRGGDLLDSLGGIDGVLGMAGKLFR